MERQFLPHVPSPPPSLPAFTFLALLTTATLCRCLCLGPGRRTGVVDVCARVVVVVGVCREKPLARQLSPAALFTELPSSPSLSSSPSLGVLEVV